MNQLNKPLYILDEKVILNENFNLNNFTLPENSLLINKNDSIKNIEFDELLAGTFSKIIEKDDKENNNIKNYKVNSNDKESKPNIIHSEEASEKSISNSNDVSNHNNLEELIKKYKEDIGIMNLQANQIHLEKFIKPECIDNNLISHEKLENLNELALSAENNFLTKGKPKIETFCNFTIEDLMEAENFSCLNQNLCDENKADFENIRVNLKSLEKFNNPERYKIVAKKAVKNDFSWYLLADKLTDLDFFSYETLLWIPAKLIENKLTLYEIDKSADVKEKNSINSMRQSKNKQCITCLKRTNSSRIRSFDININQLNEKEIKNSNSSSSKKENVNNIANRSINTEISSSRNLENFENFENYEIDQNEENGYYNNLQMDIKFNTMLREKNLEIEKLSKTEMEMNRKLKEKKIELFDYKQLFEKLMKLNNEPVNANNASKIVSFEKYELLYNQYKKEQEKLSDLAKKYGEIKNELENVNKVFESYVNEGKKAKIGEGNNNGYNDLNNKTSMVFEKENFKNIIGAKNQVKAAGFLNNAKNKFIDFHENQYSKANNPGSLVCNTFSGVNNSNFTLNSSINMESEAREKHATDGPFIV